MKLAHAKLMPKPNTENWKPGAQNRECRFRHPLLKTDVMGPTGNYFVLRVTKTKFDILEKEIFAKLIIGSLDKKFSADVILKDIDSFLALVPEYIHRVGLVMDQEQFKEKIDSTTIFRIEDGSGRYKDYLLTCITQKSG